MHIGMYACVCLVSEVYHAVPAGRVKYNMLKWMGDICLMTQWWRRF